MRWTGFILVLLGAAIAATGIIMYRLDGGSIIGTLFAAVMVLILAPTLALPAFGRSYDNKLSQLSRMTLFLLFLGAGMAVGGVAAHYFGVPLAMPCIGTVVMAVGICVAVGP